jgi:hypothetical protein
VERQLLQFFPNDFYNAVGILVSLVMFTLLAMSQLLLKIFWVIARRQFLVYNQRFGITCLSHPEDGTNK